jgi:hypothetical protein
MLLPRTAHDIQPLRFSRRQCGNPGHLPLFRRGLFLLGLRIAVVLAASAAPLRAATIVVPNGSFESPLSGYATPLVDSWQQVPQPDLGNPKTLQTGVFSNQPPTDPFHIDNCDGAQALFLFAAPQAAVFQDFDSTDWANPVPTHAFNAIFEVGKSYTLTVGIIGGTNLAIPMQEGTTLELSLYYRTNATNLVTVAATTITNSAAIFSNATHFIDFQAHLPTVQATDPWAGQHLGIQLLSTVGLDLMGGYWDLDNVRLTSTITPVLLTPAFTDGNFSFTLKSDPGLRFEILASTNAALSVSNWTSLGTLTNDTGLTLFLDLAANPNRRFYLARQLP